MLLKENYKLIMMIFLITSIELFAGGSNRTTILGARSLSLNGMYFAGIDGASNIFLNPSGLSKKFSRSFEVSGFFRQEEQSFNNANGSVHKSLLETELNYGVGIIWSFSESFTAAIGFKAVEDYHVKWPYVLLYKNAGGASTVATDMYFRSLNKSFSPSISYTWDSFSAGLTINVAQIRNDIAFAQNNFVWNGSNGLPAYQMDINHSGWTLNFVFGLLYQVNDDLRFGFSIESGRDNKFKGSARTKLYQVVDSSRTDVDVEFLSQTPWEIGLGTIFNISEKLTLNIDARYNLYGQLDEKIDFLFSDPSWQLKSQIPDTVTGLSASHYLQKFQNSIDMGFGVEYKAMQDLNIFFSYRFSQTPNTQQSFNLLNPTVSHHTIGAGFSYSDSDIKIEGSLVYYFGVEQSISNSEFKINNGKYYAKGVIPNLTLKFNL